jgi:tetratricopeptide (TPR) repeat protein
MGFVQESITLLEQVLMIFKKHYGEDHIKVAQILVILADAYKTGGLYTNAKAVLEEGHSIYKKHYNDDNITIAWTSVILSSLYKDLGNYNKSIEILENSLIVYKRHYGYNHNKTARVIRDLGAIFMSSRDLKRAEALFNEALGVNHKLCVSSIFYFPANHI